MFISSIFFIVTFIYFLNSKNPVFSVKNLISTYISSKRLKHVRRLCHLVSSIKIKK